MASCFRNIFAKNRQNPLILLKVTIDNIGVPFLRHSVYIIIIIVIIRSCSSSRGCSSRCRRTVI